MKHKDPPTTNGPRWPRAQLWGPVLVLVVIAGVVWASFWSGPGVDDATGSDRVGAAQQTGERTGAGDDTDLGAQQSEAAEPGQAEAGQAEADQDEELEESVRRFQAAQKKLAERVAAQLRKRSAPFEFRVASFNVLGDSHTGPGGNKPGFPDGSARMDMAIAALRNNDIDVVGFQEFEQSQYTFFSARAGEYAMYPDMSLGDKSVRFNIAWRTSVWTFVDAHTLSIPYAGGSRIAMPVVLLQSNATGRRAWFANFHNPADTPSLGNNARWRAEAAGIEIAHLTELRQSDGYPVIATGDYNEREEIFCRFTAGGVFSAAAGGSYSGGCAPPSRMEVDWIFGSTGVEFSGYGVADTGRASDHNMVHSTATLTAAD